MSIDFNAWLNESVAIDEDPRAAAAWRRIQDKPTTVTFRTPGGVDVGAQTVRLEYDAGASDSESDAGAGSTRKLIIFGVRNHPDASVADTEVKKGYRFVQDNKQFTDVDVITTSGEVQATAEAVS